MEHEHGIVDPRVARRWCRPFHRLGSFAALLAAFVTWSGTAAAAPASVEDHDLVRLVLLDNARETEQHCPAVSGVPASEGCLASYLRRDGSIGVVAWLTRAMPIEEYRRALPLWCESLAAVQGLSPDRCRSALHVAVADPVAESAAASSLAVSIPVGQMQSGPLLTLALGNGAGVEKSDELAARVRVQVPTSAPHSPAWRVLAQAWCHSIVYAEWQLIRQDPCHGVPTEIRVNAVPVDLRQGAKLVPVPCVGGVSQFCDPAVMMPRR